jgi:hypothetical protein
MTRLAGTVDGVIGVDPHRDTLAAAVTDSVGGLLAQTSVSADAVGYQRLLAFARAQVPGRRCRAVEGAGSCGSGLAALRSLARLRSYGLSFAGWRPSSKSRAAPHCGTGRHSHWSTA